MRDVKVTWTNDNGHETEIMGELNDSAISDLIKIIETIDGDDEYEPGMVLDLRELRP